MEKIKKEAELAPELEHVHGPHCNHGHHHDHSHKRVKVGRNDPCPCGSGKKYKKCCGEDKI